MSYTKRAISRRHFLTAVSATAAASLILRRANAESTTETAAAEARKPRDLHRIVTANILASLDEHDGTPVDWETQRRDVCFKVLKDQKADVVCLQEVLRSQYEDFLAGFPEFQVFGYEGPAMDRNPRRFKGIKNVIMFSRERYQLAAAGNYTLSDTPLIEGSASWGDNLGRHVNWVRLRDNVTGREFRVVNTHLAVRDPNSRQKSAELIVAECNQYPAEFPQILAGDFNANDNMPAIRIIKGGGWKDTYEAVHGDNDPGHTGHGFNRQLPEPGAKDVQIDWIFCRGAIDPVAAKVIHDKVNGHYPSDHLFVSADLQI